MKAIELATMYSELDNNENAFLETKLAKGQGWVKTPNCPSLSSNADHWRVTLKPDNLIDLSPFVGTKALFHFFNDEYSFMGFLTKITDKGYFTDVDEWSDPFPHCEFVTEFWNHGVPGKIPNGINAVLQAKSGAILHTSKVESWNNLLSYNVRGLYEEFEYKVFG